MKEFHCDALKNLPVPIELMQKALDIPAANPAPVIRVPVKRRIRWAFAASLILVCTLSLSVYFLFRNINHSPIAAVPTEDDVCAPTEESTVLPSEYPTVPMQIQPTVSPTQPPTVPATAPPTEPSAEPSQAVVPTEQLQQSTEAPEPTSPSDPITPTVNPTESPTEEPFDAPPSPTEADVVAQSDFASVGYMVPITGYNGSDDLYCRLYSSSGCLMGSDALFDESHRVYFTTGSGYLFLSYPLGSLVEPLVPDNYTIIFYDGDGNDFYICSAFLSKR